MQICICAYSYINKKAAEKGKKQKKKNRKEFLSPKQKAKPGKVSSPNSPHRNVEKDVA